MIKQSLLTGLGGESKCPVREINVAEHGLWVPNGCFPVHHVYAIVMILYRPQEQ